MKKFIFLTIICVFFFAGCAGGQKRTPAGAYGNGPPVSADKRAKIDQAVKEWNESRGKLSASSSAPMIEKTKPETAVESKAKAEPEPLTPVPPAFTGKPNPPPVVIPPVKNNPSNPGHEGYASRADLDDLRKEVKEVKGVLAKHDQSIAYLASAESVRSGLERLEIFFPNGVTALGPQQKASVKDKASKLNALARGGKVKVIIRGYSSLPGAENENLKRSQERADNVKREIQPLLQNVEIIESRGVGESDGGVYGTSNQCVRIFVVG